MLVTLSRNERDIRHSEERLQLALKSSGEGLWEWDLRGDRIYIDHYSNSLLKFNQFLDSIDLELFHKSVFHEDKKRVYQKLQRIAQGEVQSYSDEFRLILRTKEIIWVRVNGKIAEYDGLRSARIAGTLQNITTRKNTRTEFVVVRFCL